MDPAGADVLPKVPPDPEPDAIFVNEELPPFFPELPTGDESLEDKLEAGEGAPLPKLLPDWGPLPLPLDGFAGEPVKAEALLWDPDPPALEAEPCLLEELKEPEPDFVKEELLKGEVPEEDSGGKAAADSFKEPVEGTAVVAVLDVEATPIPEVVPMWGRARLDAELMVLARNRFVSSARLAWKLREEIFPGPFPSSTPVE